MSDKKIPKVPKAVLGRTKQISSHMGLGFGAWPFQIPYKQFLDTLRSAFDYGIRHLDASTLYCTEKLLARALKDLDVPDDIFLSTKACAFRDDEIGIEYQEYSGKTVVASVERSLRQLQVDCLDCVHIHDPLPEDLDQVYAKDGALDALLDLKQQGVIKSCGMATVSLESLQTAIDCGQFDHIQFFHSYTLLNQEAMANVIPAARAKNLSVLNNAPQAGFILATGVVPNACYNYWPATQDVIDATARIEEVCKRKGVAIAEAALAYSLKCREIDVTVVGAESPERIYQCVKAYNSPLTSADFEEMIAAAGGPYPIKSPHGGNPWHSGPWKKTAEHQP